MEKMPGHWLLARMGKRVLRPGGIELTRELLAALAIGSQDDVVEFAPGLGATARLTLQRQPHSYTAVERDQQAAAEVEKLLAGVDRRRCMLGSAEEAGLPDASASVVYGEAMLSMQPETTKARIIAEAVRLLVPGGRCGIHELCVLPDDLDEATLAAIQEDLSGEIHVGVRPLSLAQWRTLLESAGMTVTWQQTAPMHLLEPARLIRDEGPLRAARFIWNVARHAPVRRRVLAMRRSFHKYGDHLGAVALVGVKSSTQN
jgi:SAM-dependent methyltransferase